MYTPDNWSVIKITSSKGKNHYRVLGGWNGGYLQGSSWRLNSGITKVEKEGRYYLFHGQTGSVYKCHEDACRITAATAGVYEQIKAVNGASAMLMPEDTNWLEVDWNATKEN